MPDNIPQIPISFGLDPKDAQILAQIAKDIDVIVKALDKLGSKSIINEKDAKEAKTLVDRIEQLKKKQAEALGYVEKMRLEQKRLRLEMEAAEKSALPGIKRQLQQVNTELNKATSTTNNWGNALGSFQFKFNALGNIVANITSAISIGMVAALNSVVQSTIKFEKAFAAAKSIMSAQDVKNFGDALEKSVVQTMVKYGLTIEDVNRALYDALSSQVKAADAAMVLEAAAKLSTAGLTSMDAAMKGIVSIINAYSLSMSEADRVGAVFFQSQVDAIATIDEMVDAFGRMNTVASISGASIEEVAATFSAITLTGLNAEEAVTGIRNIFSELLSPAEQSKKALSSIGLAYGAAGLKAQGYNNTIIALNKAFKEQPDIVNNIFGNIRGLTAVYALLGERFDEFQGIYQKVLDGYQAGINYEQGMQTQLETTKTKVEQLKAAWNALWIEMDSGNGIMATLVKSVVDGTRLMLEGLRGGEGPGPITFLGEEEAKKQADDFFKGIKSGIESGSVTSTEAMMKAADELGKAYTEMMQQEFNPDLKAKTEIYYKELVRLYTEVFAKAVSDGTKDVVPLNERLIADLEMQKKKLEEKLVTLKANDFAGRDEIKNQINEIQKILDEFYGKQAKQTKKSADDLTKAEVEKVKAQYELQRMSIELMEDGSDKERALAKNKLDETLAINEILITDTERRYQIEFLLTQEFNQKVSEINAKYRDKDKKETIESFEDRWDTIYVQFDAFAAKMENEMRENGATEEEITRAVNIEKLRLDLDYYRKKLELLQSYSDADQEEVKRLLANIDRIEAQIVSAQSTVEKKTGDSLLAKAFGLTDQEANELQSALGELEQQINEITDAYVRAAEERVDAIEEEISASEERERQLESDRDHEWERMKEGYANNYALKQKELADERQRQEKLRQEREKALREAEKRKRIQIGIDTALTTAKLILGAAEIFANEGSKGIIGVVLALAGVAAMIAGFVAAQSTVKSSVDLEYGKGGYFELDGPSHQNGGVDIGGGREAEGGEGVSIFSRRATNRYNKEIKDFTRAANNGQLLTGWDTLTAQLHGQQLPSQTYVLSDEYSRKIYDLQKSHFAKDDIKVVQISPTRTMIISDNGRHIKYVNHPAHANG